MQLECCLLCIGKGTRISEYLLNVDKEYIAELTLGISNRYSGYRWESIKLFINKKLVDEIYIMLLITLKEKLNKFLLCILQ